MKVQSQFALVVDNGEGKTYCLLESGLKVRKVPFDKFAFPPEHFQNGKIVEIEKEKSKLYVKQSDAESSVARLKNVKDEASFIYSSKDIDLNTKQKLLRHLIRTSNRILLEEVEAGGRQKRNKDNLLRIAEVDCSNVAEKSVKENISRMYHSIACTEPFAEKVMEQAKVKSTANAKVKERVK